MSESDDKAEDDEVELKVSEAIVRERLEGFGKVGQLWRFEVVSRFFFIIIFLIIFGFVFLNLDLCPCLSLNLYNF